MAASVNGAVHAGGVYRRSIGAYLRSIAEYPADFWVMAVAVILSMIVLMLASGPVADFVEAHPTVKILALGFLIMIGMALVADGFGAHVPKGYIYSAMVFSIFIELINMAQRRRKPARCSKPRGTSTPRSTLRGSRHRRPAARRWWC